MIEDLPDATFDYVCHPMICLRCGKMPLDPCDIDLQNKLARDKKLRKLRIGDRFELEPRLQENGGYLELREEHDKTRLTVIETWSCPICGANFLWARILLENEALQSVEPIQLTDATLGAADFITGEVLTLVPMEITLELKKMTAEEFRRDIIMAEISHLRTK